MRIRMVTTGQKTYAYWLLMCFVCATMAAVPSPAAQAPDAKACLDRIGIDRGVCVLLASDPADLAIAMARESELIIYAQLPDAGEVHQTRRTVDAAGLLGTRIYVEQGDWSRLHLATNLADALVVTPECMADVQDHVEELLRVVRPSGKVLLGTRESVKPYPAEADDWSHPYHGPDNNPQSADRLAVAPYLTQFLAEPYYSPFPEVTVASHGRTFKAFGHVGYKKRDWPWLNKLVAINGYNGTLLWTRDLEAGFNIHRNTMVATPEVLYVADSRSCQRLNASTGELLDEIVAPEGASGPVWKWLAIQDGVMYAMVGEAEFRDETLRGTRTEAGWPWRPMTAGYDSQEYLWGYGKTLFAMDLQSQQVLWMRKEEQRIDGRAVAMTGQRIYYYSPGAFLACRYATSGELVWKNSGDELLDAIGSDARSQTARLGFASTAYLKSSDQAVYFAGPQRANLVAASTEDGRLLWQVPHGNYQLVLREQGLYALGRTGPSMLLDPLTGEVRADLDCLRGNCTRVTGTRDSIFGRGHDHAGTLRLKVADNQPRRIGLMRPACHDGVIATAGHLYWGPWMCDCSLSLVGHICLAPAGDFPFQAEAVEADRLEAAENPAPLQPLTVAAGDWPTYRADNQCSAAVEVTVPGRAELLWRYDPPQDVVTTAPVTAGGLVFLGGSDGTVRALDAATGQLRWSAYTGGPIPFPPTVADGRLLAGSGDGWVYAWEAATGRPLWRFRVAPAERKISVYGRLSSTWPVASGVLVDAGVAYAAAGIASYDGTHVVALDAVTGNIRWQNNRTGHLLGDDRVTGVSVQGHMLLDGDRLYLAGGNVISPAVFDVADGRLLNELSDEWGGQEVPAPSDWQNPEDLERKAREQKTMGKSPRGCDLSLIDGRVTAFDRLLYSPQEYWVGRYFPQPFIQAGKGDRVVRARAARIDRVATVNESPGDAPGVWENWGFLLPKALAATSNAVLAAGQSVEEGEEPPHAMISAMANDDSGTLWSHRLPALPAWWGLATDSQGRVLLTLEDGSVMCFGQR